ncbi:MULTISPECIES: DNA-3-methyladenine glycosylase family protein [unclassified Sphingomonas]|uniref:DNA-3-methyladenine glycosylase family protein n=1 Tax=unclassified Sphingomonas TaxID=196159 RepID=UPI00070087F3|nr:MULTISPECIES: DNA-3-methyladenine glycosylase [unclassified Sphingomonas]KQX20853.1 DNA glycosylase [Sphingomonas sp. Root1294]KQY68699.1 DNA glycosylase [Sphingomonas sp. Root50]KRB88103.1 DNA glycosylase [Sphingomonas sp. Root720]
MSLSADQLRRSLDALADVEPAFRHMIGSIGYPEPRIRARGYQTLLRTIVGQQVSVAAANAIWARMEAMVGAGLMPEAVAAAPDELLRAAGLSRQKAAYAKSLADHVASGTIDFDRLPPDDEEAIAQMTAIKGIGRWSAEIYLLFAEGRGDIWPAGDLAVQIEVGRLLGLPERPSERETRRLAQRWSPHRGAAAVFTWHSYSARAASAKAGKADKMPL